MQRKQSMYHSSSESKDILQINDNKFSLNKHPEDNFTMMKNEIYSFDKSNTNVQFNNENNSKPMTIASNPNTNLKNNADSKIMNDQGFERNQNFNPSKMFTSFNKSLIQPQKQNLQNEFCRYSFDQQNFNQIRNEQNLNPDEEIFLNKRNNFHFLNQPLSTKKNHSSPYDTFPKMKSINNYNQKNYFSQEFNQNNHLKTNNCHQNNFHISQNINFNQTPKYPYNENDINIQSNHFFSDGNKLNAFDLYNNKMNYQKDSEYEKLNSIIKSPKQNINSLSNFQPPFTNLNDNKLYLEETVKEDKDFNEEIYSGKNKNCKDKFNNLSCDTFLNKYTWQKEIDIEEKKKLKKFVLKMMNERENLEKQISVVLNRIRLLERRSQMFMEKYKATNENKTALFNSNKNECSDITVNLMISFGSKIKENDSEEKEIKNDYSSDLIENNINQLKPLIPENKLKNDSINCIIDNDITKNKNLLTNQSKMKNSKSRSSYVMEKDSDYVIIRFDNLKKKTTNKIIVPIDKLFPKLQTVMLNILWGIDSSQNELNNLSENDKNIIKHFLLKKKLLKPNEELEFTENNFNQICKNNGAKRNEENFKCVFKYAIKFLKKEFRINNSSFKFRKQIKDLKNQYLVELAFYIHYFGEIADDLGCSIFNFFHPGGNTKDESFIRLLDDNKQRPKTINKDYIEKIKKSAKFMSDFKDYLNNTFIRSNNEVSGIISQYKVLAQEKLYKKLEVWFNKFQKDGWKKTYLEIIQELKNNSKCKLPWSLNEMKKAVQDTKEEFDIQDHDSLS